MAMHADQLEVDVETVRRLVATQFPEWDGLPISEVDSAGTVNAIFRVGTHLAARYPLQRSDPSECRNQLQIEFDASAELSRASTVPTPEPLAIGRPGEGYPLPWIVQTWVPGHDATVEDPARSLEFAADLAHLIRALRSAGPRGRTFDGRGRGGHLPDHDAWLDRCFGESQTILDVPLLRSIWADLRTLPEVDSDAMSHRDITPPNVLVEGGRLVGLLDGGSFGPADPALDLVGAWHLLDSPGREVVRHAVNASDVQWERGMAWAFQQAMGLVWYYPQSNPTMSRWGRRTLDRIVEACAGP